MPGLKGNRNWDGLNENAQKLPLAFTFSGERSNNLKIQLCWQENEIKSPVLQT
jgi:hypothetical protein